MKQKGPRLVALFFALFAVAGGVRAQEENGHWVFQDITPGPHRGAVNSLHYDGERLLSVGEDGFLELWDQDQALLRFQISGLPISAAALRPGTSQIACIETDSLGQYRISVWDYRTLENLFTLRFRDPVQNLSYSAGGSYLIICRSGTTGLVLVDGDTGELLLDPRNIPEDFPSNVSFAAIGRTERVLLTYSPAGVLSYWELKTDGGLRLAPSYDSFARPLNFDAPASLGSPVLFGNNRFFAGIDRGGLVILRADTGAELARDSSVSQGQLSSLGAELYCLVKTGGRADGVLRFRMGSADRVERREYFTLPSSTAASALLPFSPGTAELPKIALGTAEGELLTADPRYSLYAAQKLTTRAQTRIPEIAAGAGSIAFLTGEDRLGYIPLDFLELGYGDAITLEPAAAYTRITVAGDSAAGGPVTGSLVTGSPAAGGPAADRFLLWQDGSPRPP
ncbi:MAG: WD40 repeat domain-containing protein, partial [Treponema sp.]|nr:WD40 repeat domain-containing protein [Treponema sp.]